MWRTGLLFLLLTTAMTSRAAPTDVQTTAGVASTPQITLEVTSPTADDYDNPIPTTREQRKPVRTGGKPLPTPASSIGQVQNDKIADPSLGGSSNFFLVPVVSQNYYYTDGANLRQAFGGDHSPIGGFSFIPMKPQMDGAMMDSLLTRQSGGTWGGGITVADRFNMFAQWLMSLVPFRIEFVRPTTPGTGQQIGNRFDYYNPNNVQNTRPWTYTGVPKISPYGPNKPVASEPVYNDLPKVEVGTNNKPTQIQQPHNSYRTNVPLIQPYPFRPYPGEEFFQRGPGFNAVPHFGAPMGRNLDSNRS